MSNGKEITTHLIAGLIKRSYKIIEVLEETLKWN